MANGYEEIDEGIIAGFCSYSLQVECIKKLQLRIGLVRVGAYYGQSEADEEHRNCDHSHGQGR